MKELVFGLVSLGVAACAVDEVRWGQQATESPSEEDAGELIAPFVRGARVEEPGEVSTLHCDTMRGEALVAHDEAGCIVGSLCQAYLDRREGEQAEAMNYSIGAPDYTVVVSVMVESADGLTRGTLPCQSAADCPDFMVCLASTSLLTGLDQPTKQCLLPHTPQEALGMGGAGSADPAGCPLDTCRPLLDICEADADCCDGACTTDGYCGSW